MKKIISILVFGSTLLFAFSAPVFSFAAADSGLPSRIEVPTADTLGIQRSPVESAQDINNLVIFATKGFYTMFFVFAVIFILVAAYKYLTAGGEPEKIKTAHKMLIWSVVAISIALLSVAAAQIMESFLSSS